MDVQKRLDQASANARKAEAQGDDGLAMAEWRRYRLIKDSMRDSEELLTEGIDLSVRAIRLASTLS